MSEVEEVLLVVFAMVGLMGTIVGWIVLAATWWFTMRGKR